MDKQRKGEPAKNQIIELEITAMGSQGEGIGHHDGMAVFVPATAPGDRIRARLLKVKKNLAYARTEKLLAPSPDRVPRDCAAYPQCGGCAYRHISYEAECRIKRQRVIDAMKRLGGIDIEPERFLGAENPDRYRNKAQLPCQADRNGRAIFGFYAGHSHRLVETADCLLQPEGFSAIAKATSDYMTDKGVAPYNEEAHTGLMRHLYMRRSRLTGETMVCAVINGDALPDEEAFADRVCRAEPSVGSVIINSNTERTNVILGERCRVVRGGGYITDSLLDTLFRVSPLSFYQVNPRQAERLYEIAAEYAAPDKDTLLLDMYCGAGTIGLTMARSVKKVIGVEIVPEAIEDARLNAGLNGADNTEFICADASQAAAMLMERGERPQVIVVDPPRKGCEVELLDTTARLAPERIVYVSCDPATLARDAARLAELGYSVRRLSAVDMFPRTVHVEAVCLLTKDI